MRVFILEDDYTRVALFNEALAGSVVAHATNVVDALKILSKAKNDGEDFDLFLLDHDLGGETEEKSRTDTILRGLRGETLSTDNSGSGFVRSELAQEMMKDKVVIIHSYNPDGAEYMLSKTKHARRDPFGLGLLTLLRKGLNGTPSCNCANWDNPNADKFQMHAETCPRSGK